MCLKFVLFIKSLILNEIYSASLFYHLFLSCYIFKYVIIIDGEWDGYEESPPTWNLCPQPRFYLYGDGDGDGDGFESEDGDGKAIPSPALPHCHPYCPLRKM